MREDTFTNTPEDAAAYERLRGMDEWIDNRPTAAELADEHTSGHTYAATAGADLARAEADDD